MADLIHAWPIPICAPCLVGPGLFATCVSLLAAAPKSTETMAGGTGAPPDQRKRKAPALAAGAEDEEEVEAEVEELESEVADLDRRTLEHLRRTATRLSDAAFSRLAALRPPARLGTPPHPLPASQATVLC
jgi:hypothetical protein